MGSRSYKPILIVGGGIGGLAAALALAREGLSVHLLEQSQKFSEIGAGIQLGPNVFKMFDKLGLSERVKQLAVFPENLIMMDCITGQEVTRVPLGAPFLERFKQPYAVIHRADLHRVLLESCQQMNNIQLMASQRVVAIDQNDSGVRVVTENGRQCDGAALIGADGVWSIVRSHVVNDGRPRISGHIAYRAVLPIEEIPEALRLQSMVVWAGEKTHLVHYPLRMGNLFNLVAVFHSERFAEGWDSFGDVEELQQQFAGTCTEVRTLLSKIESWRMWVLCDRSPVKEWSLGRITLLGDAAHPMLQYLAQGANMAIEDAVSLSQRIAESDGDYVAAFRAYEGARYLRTGRTQIMARVYGEVFHAGGVAREIRNMILGGRTPAAAYESMSWLYDDVAL